MSVIKRRGCVAVGLRGVVPPSQDPVRRERRPAGARREESLGATRHFSCLRRPRSAPLAPPSSPAGSAPLAPPTLAGGSPASSTHARKSPDGPGTMELAGSSAVWLGTSHQFARYRNNGTSRQLGSWLGTSHQFARCRLHRVVRECSKV